MSSDTTQTSHARNRLPFKAALAVVLLMALAYTAHDTLQIGEPLFSLISFVPGAISVWVLLAAGFSLEACNLAARWFSRRGIAVLGLAFLLLLPVLLSGRLLPGWDPLATFVYAPASGVAQELYFRSALLPALKKGLGGRLWPALLVHCLIFVGYHFRTFRSIGAVGPAMVVGVVLFLGGLAWGWHSQRDRTILWTSVQHSLFLMAMSLFTWG
ncbi:MAG: hypothetical protein PHS96_15185 [Anaerolineales bacterium]|nr:hypothetical protein [Anaerolineales bacterium]